MGSGCALFNDVLQGAEQAKRHVRTLQSSLCLCAGKKKTQYRQRETKKRSAVVAIVNICITIMTDTEPIP